MPKSRSKVGFENFFSPGGCRRRIVPLLSFWVLESAAFGQVPPGYTVSAPFQVNTYITGLQSKSDVSYSPDGSFVVVWESYAQVGYPSTWSVHAQRFDSLGADQGAQFQVETYTSGVQRAPGISHGPDGTFVIVWHSAAPGTFYSVRGQRYSSLGTKLGNEFVVETWTTGHQAFPSISHALNGNFVVAWDSEGADGYAASIRAQRYSSSGNKIGGEFGVNTYTIGSQWKADISHAPDGSFVIAWNEPFADTSGFAVHAQRLSSSGTKLGTEFRVNSYTTNWQVNPSVSHGPDGSFVVAWESWGGQDGSQRSVQAQRYASDGDTVGGEFVVNTLTLEDQSEAHVSHDPDGGFVVVWEWNYGSYPNNQRRAEAKVYDSTGSPRGGEFQLVPAPPHTKQYVPSVDHGPDGAFVVAWTGVDDSIEAEIFAQRFKPSLVFADGFETGNTSRWPVTVSRGR